MKYIAIPKTDFEWLMDIMDDTLSGSDARDRLSGIEEDAVELDPKDADFGDDEEED